MTDPHIRIAALRLAIQLLGPGADDAHLAAVVALSLLLEEHIAAAPECREAPAAPDYPTLGGVG